MKRELRKLETPTVTPSTVSQLTCLAVLGIDPRRFLEMIVPRCAHVAKVGRLRVVAVDEACRAIFTHADAGPEGVEPHDEWSVDSVLAKLGRRRVTR